MWSLLSVGFFVYHISLYSLVTFFIIVYVFLLSCIFIVMYFLLLLRMFRSVSPTGRRIYGRPSKRLLDTWDRNGSTSGPTPWKIDDDDDNNNNMLEIGVGRVFLQMQWFLSLSKMLWSNSVRRVTSQCFLGTFAKKMQNMVTTCFAMFVSLHGTEWHPLDRFL
jgi:hypothetical protein